MPCEHKHRSLAAAKKCAKWKARGVPAGGGENMAVVYGEDGRAVAQMRVFSDVRANSRSVTWRTRTEEVAPGTPFWRQDVAA